MNKMLRLEKNIEFDNFTKLLDLCFELSSYFSFTKNGYEVYSKGITHAEFLQEMAPFYVKTILTQHWHCYYRPPGYTIEVYLYKADKPAKTIIQKYFDNIFLQDRNPDGILGNVKNTPEDLCFFAENRLLLGTVSHEDICYAFPFSEEISNEFKRLGEWKEKEYSPEEHIVIEI